MSANIEVLLVVLPSSLGWLDDLLSDWGWLASMGLPWTAVEVSLWLVGGGVWKL